MYDWRLYSSLITFTKSDSQRAEIQQWLGLHDHDPEPVLWFEDKETGATLNREAFQRLQEAVFNGEIKTVIVWKLDRLAHSMREGVNVLTDCCERGVRVVSVTQQIDLSGTIGHLVAGVLFAIAEIELQHTKGRQAAGIAVAKEKGSTQVGRKVRSRQCRNELEN